MKIVGWELVYARATNDPRSRHGSWRRPVAQPCAHKRRGALDGRGVCLDCGERVR